MQWNRALNECSIHNQSKNIYIVPADITPKDDMQLLLILTLFSLYIFIHLIAFF